MSALDWAGPCYLCFFLFCLWYFIEKHKHTNKQTHKGTNEQQKHTHIHGAHAEICVSLWGNNSLHCPEYTNTSWPTCVLCFICIFFTNYTLSVLFYLFLMSTGAERSLLTCHTACVCTFFPFFSHTHRFANLPSDTWKCAGFVIFHWTHVRLADAKTFFAVWLILVSPWRIYHLELIWRIKGRCAWGHRNVDSWNIFIAIITWKRRLFSNPSSRKVN